MQSIPYAPVKFAEPIQVVQEQTEALGSVRNEVTQLELKLKEKDQSAQHLTVQLEQEQAKVSGSAIQCAHTYNMYLHGTFHQVALLDAGEQKQVYLSEICAT